MGARTGRKGTKQVSHKKAQKAQKAQEEFLMRPIQVSELFLVLFVPFVPYVAGNNFSSSISQSLACLCVTVTLFSGSSPRCSSRDLKIKVCCYVAHYYWSTGVDCLFSSSVCTGCKGCRQAKRARPRCWFGSDAGKQRQQDRRRRWPWYRLRQRQVN